MDTVCIQNGYNNCKNSSCKDINNIYIYPTHIKRNFNYNNSILELNKGKEENKRKKEKEKKKTKEEREKYYFGCQTVDNWLPNGCQNYSDDMSELKERLESFSQAYPELDFSNYSLAGLEKVNFDKLDKALQESSWLRKASFGFLLKHYDRVIEGEFRDLKGTKNPNQAAKLENQWEYSKDYMDSLIKKVEEVTL